ncbi:MAG: MaoC family dehydratase N-terminal domain-containing protein [Chloroflexi bacterium]|nr:MaoC family dehydratase N-terminal domain-containing protein [Chloroflexota bacterium]
MTTATKYKELTDQMFDEARQLIGVPLRRLVVQTTASRDLVCRFGLSIGTRNNLYLSENLASTNVYGKQVGHPTMLYCFNDTMVAPKFPGIHAIYGGADWEWFAPIRVGDKIRSESKLIDVQEKHGRFCGRMALEIGETTFHNQRDRLAARAISYVLRTPRDAAVKNAKYLGMSKYAYSEADLQRIDKSYDAEEVRGAVPRYWEDTQIGEELTPVVKGPLATDDMLCFMDALGGILAEAYFVDYARRHPDYVYWDPVTGHPESWEVTMAKDSAAREFGFPGVHDTGIGRICWAEDLITNWMGDMAWLRSLKMRLVRPCLEYDTTWSKGKVVKKYSEGPQRLVDLEVWCEDQRGEVTARGSATVALLTREVDILLPQLRFPGGYPKGWAGL